MAETEKRIAGSQSRKARASVDFPAPDGEERMIKSPRRFSFKGIWLLDILDLFPHLVDDCLEIETYAGEIGGLGL